MVAYRLAHGRLQTGTWSPTDWHMVAYRLAHGCLQTGTWSPTDWHMVAYILAHGCLQTGNRPTRYVVYAGVMHVGLCAAQTNNMSRTEWTCSMVCVDKCNV